MERGVVFENERASRRLRTGNTAVLRLVFYEVMPLCGYHLSTNQMPILLTVTDVTDVKHFL